MCRPVLALFMIRLFPDVWFSAATLSWLGKGDAVVSAALEIGVALLHSEPPWGHAVVCDTVLT
ncbi:hypothetical protein [Mycobacterium lepromatosis]|uniref:hypothetical protein n=1 Tax=Mycobacterium lepromatosis TaxID=480418 RepID=UPI0006785A52|nr:hypothetical protein [Mycobacterium lepromatosis]